MVGADDQHGTDGVDRGLDRRRRVEVISGVERRRRWSREEKTQITVESFASGANVSDVARRHGVSLGLLHHWRRLARQHASPDNNIFVPILPIKEPGETGSGPDASIIEIGIGGVSIRVRGQVDEVALRTVIAAVRAA